MAKRKSNARNYKATRKSGAGSSKAQKIALAIVIIIVIIAVTCGALWIAFVATDGFGGRINTLFIEIEGKKYSKSAEDIIIYPGTEIRIDSMSKIPYEVKIEASDRADFAFSVAGERGYRWAHLAGRDFTKYFEMTEGKSGFTVQHNGINGILTAYYGGDASSDEAITPRNLFVMIVKCGERERRFGFFPALTRPTDVTLDPDQIVM